MSTVVVGGVYQEICVDAGVDEIFGSAGRAAIALASQGEPVVLHTYLFAGDAEAAGLALEPGGVTIRNVDRAERITFRYLHSLAKPTVSPWPVTQEALGLEVQAEQILIFGMLEGRAKVEADLVVFDPQGSDPKIFLGSDNKIGRLALVLNSHELRRLSDGGDELQSVQALSASTGAEIVIVKAGAIGARIYSHSTLQGSVPPYRTDRVYKIGSGDMFSAAFFQGWAKLGLGALEAADYASRSTARYCDTRSPSLLAPDKLSYLQPLTGEPQGQVYIASPFFSLADLWLVEEAARALWEVGSKPFSPFHEIGLGKPHSVAAADLEALKNSTAVLAIASGGDPGTLFEIGYAVSLGIPVVALSQNGRPADMTMLEGTGCQVSNDFASAIYQASWATRS
ncbi:PfkB family carbohydrate kinase [Brevundimonas sp.]|uniref:PfkB family carbohydrate kinase n=1 Tax=Brevundimonas sp. TaxID=1871086 RepID=UPI001A3109E6|nr:PfkB family carbohydrate kinase [Brevundimonas sp.]MBJ7486515.1 nucleoside 2-deoxyribosyltransferase [Brevundimonas sp.]